MRKLIPLAVLFMCAPAFSGHAQDSYTILHNFSGGAHDGASTYGNLTLYNGKFYGMTFQGGIGSCTNGCGTLFSMGMGGTNFTVMHSFGLIITDGREPYGSLTPAGGRLFGMTPHGGLWNQGTIFSVNPSAPAPGYDYRIDHSFNSIANDGKSPQSSLLAKGGKLYGMAEAGGAHMGGVLFSLNTDGSGYAILHHFGDPAVAADGRQPYGTPISDGSRLYGMTNRGGRYTYGVIFSMSMSDSADYDILYDFRGAPDDGTGPVDDLLLIGSTLYGMTAWGGKYSDAWGEYGTAFSLRTNGAEYKVLHNFAGGEGDGRQPQGSFIANGGVLYGMTFLGGSAEELGTIFCMNTDGSGFSILHRFDFVQGGRPSGSLISDDGCLYGMAGLGGSGGEGVIFSYELPTPNYINLTTAPDGVSPGGMVNLSWECDFSTWNYRDLPVDIYLAAVMNPTVADAPSSVSDARAGARIYYFANGLAPSTALEGPVYRGVRFPPVPLTGSLQFHLPNGPTFAGEWKFATAFFYSGGGPVRTDGMPVENSDLFTVR